jgi:deazaflavin-dependent oxidoreductase (nitroreductase family)
MNDFNANVIEQFRANDGKVGGNFEGASLLLLHSRGARSGEPRLHPVMYQRDGDRYLVFASKAGADTNPDWYHNLVAHPDVTIEVGTDTLAVHATELSGSERDEAYAEQVRRVPTFGDYEAKTSRVILPRLRRSSWSPAGTRHTVRAPSRSTIRVLNTRRSSTPRAAAASLA